MDRKKDLRFVIIGAGMAGMLAAIRLREAGYKNIQVLEKGDSVGGTWRENRYAGLACDVPAHAYTYSFAPNPDWSSYLAPGPEIHRYFESVKDRFGIGDLIRFNEEVTSSIFRDGAWYLETKSGLKLEADFVIAATGVLHHPRMPDIKGLESFAGPMFHSARWDDSVQLDGRRVGIIGNGSTGVQMVSALCDRVAHLSHFQRSPQWIMPVENKPYTEEQRAAFHADPALIDAIRYGDAYEGIVRHFTDAIIDMNSPGMAQIEAVALENLEKSIADPVLREKLRPNYRAACKRLIMSPDYYQAVQRDTVEVVTDGIEQIEPEGVRTRDGVLHKLDVLLLATGFYADRFVRPITVQGRNGADLNEFWAKRPTAYLAVTLPDFPNFFLLNGPTGPVGNFSLIDIAERQWGYIEQLIDLVGKGECDQVSPSHAAMADYEERRIKAARNTIFASGCTSWYLDAEGVPASWPWSYDQFAKEMAAPKLEAYELSRAD